MNFHQANIFVFQDLDNYIVVNTGFCQPCPVGGHGYFMETVVTGGGALNHYELPRNAEDLNVYLKIEIVGDVISGYYATQPGEWNRIGRFGNFYDLNSIGLSARIPPLQAEHQRISSRASIISRWSYRNLNIFLGA